jgi:hypothetical protein
LFGAQTANLLRKIQMIVHTIVLAKSTDFHAMSTDLLRFYVP